MGGLDTLFESWYTPRMSIPGWKPNPKWVDDCLERNKWAQWLVLAVAIAWFVAFLVTTLQG
jgi:hypothetical protein